MAKQYFYYQVSTTGQNYLPVLVIMIGFGFLVLIVFYSIFSSVGEKDSTGMNLVAVFRMPQVKRRGNGLGMVFFFATSKRGDNP
jgi:hypothetical protein